MEVIERFVQVLLSLLLVLPYVMVRAESEALKGFGVGQPLDQYLLYHSEFHTCM